MVVIDLPLASLIVVTQDRTASPSRWMVQAPQAATPQPNFVPVRPSSSRRYQSSGIDGSPSNVCSCPLTFKVAINPSLKPLAALQPSYVAEFALRARRERSLGRNRGEQWVEAVRAAVAAHAIFRYIPSGWTELSLLTWGLLELQLVTVGQSDCVVMRRCGSAATLARNAHE